MKRIKTTDITTVAGLPISGATLDFLQDFSEEMLNLICQSIIGPSYDSADVYMIQGGVDGVAGPNNTFSNGLILWGGGLYRLIAATLPQLGFLTAQCNFVDTYLSGTDPTLFSNGTSYNVHRDRCVQIVSGTSGSGDFNYDDIIFINGDDTFSLNTNYLNASTYGTRKVRMQNLMVTFNGGITLDTGAALNQVITTLKKKYRPSGQARYIDAHINTFGSFTLSVTVKIDTNGEVSMADCDGTLQTGGTILNLTGLSYYTR
jgi:hypothetical protein